VSSFKHRAKQRSKCSVFHFLPQLNSTFFAEKTYTCWLLKHFYSNPAFNLPSVVTLPNLLCCHATQFTVCCHATQFTFAPSVVTLPNLPLHRLFSRYPIYLCTVCCHATQFHTPQLWSATVHIAEGSTETVITLIFPELFSFHNICLF
jgi:hypothetical protein